MGIEFSVAELVILIGCLVGIFGLIINGLNLGRSKELDKTADTREMVELRVKLDGIDVTCKEIKTLQGEYSRGQREVENRLSAVEQSCKSAHRRIDGVVYQEHGEFGDHARRSGE